MSETALVENYLLVGSVLFGVGLAGFLVRRNMIVMFLSVEMMLQGVSISLVAWGRFHNNWDGQSLVIFVIAVAACEAGIALALVLMLFQRGGSLDVVLWQHLGEEGRRPYVERAVPPEREEVQIWPTLTPAGVEPKGAGQEETYRSHV
jgi:NADH-quinone oxidoreductase subunit K